MRHMPWQLALANTLGRCEASSAVSPGTPLCTRGGARDTPHEEQNIPRNIAALSW
jgi:hypothetical protein